MTAALKDGIFQGACSQATDALHLWFRSHYIIIEPQNGSFSLDSFRFNHFMQEKFQE